MQISQLDTPALLIEKSIMEKNIKRMQELANQWHVSLRPHTKTHKTPEIAKMQIEAGARGITVAKTGEAEVMANAGINDIFIANEIVGSTKLKRIRRLCEEGKKISFGLDSIEALEQIIQVFDKKIPAHILIEVETGDKRSGVTDEHTFIEILKVLKEEPAIEFEGIFSHEGHTYSAPDTATASRLFLLAQEDTLRYVEIARQHGLSCNRVSIGSTPGITSAHLHGGKILDGITEIRPGTYIFMDAGQAKVIGSYRQCAATVLATIISKPTKDRTIADAGAKALTMQSRMSGICQTEGKGTILEPLETVVSSVYDEHTIFTDNALHEAVSIGDTVRIIPNHICPVVNLYDQLYIVDGEKVVSTYRIACRGKTT
ncbi:alanine racemase [Pleomorphochaeta sp. DL1XJH-081]|uniref:alanine racemase n=1 Tax=Pleomorphochaeta sp. DL1XJH-081 TaxID=3409690 RepID=UPI003BB62583